MRSEQCPGWVSVPIIPLCAPRNANRLPSCTSWRPRPQNGQRHKKRKVFGQASYMRSTEVCSYIREDIRFAGLAPSRETSQRTARLQTERCLAAAIYCGKSSQSATCRFAHRWGC